MPASLTLRLLNQEPFELEIGNTATIGRSKTSDICLEEDLRVSRQHAVIRCQDRVRFHFVDLGSRNGSFVDGRQVVLPVELKEGSLIKVGTTEMVFHLPDFSSGDGEDMGGTMAGSGQTIQEIKHDVFDAAMLVCDVRGFSSCSEKLPPNEVAHFIGHWFFIVGELVEKHGGRIDKFIGDAILAYWVGAAGEACPPAFATACEMEKEASKLVWPQLGLPMKTVVAMHYGRVSSGNIGVVAQRDATIMGDAVNTVFRLEGETKALGVSLLCSDPFYAGVAPVDGFRDLGEVSLKGKSRPVKVFGR